MIQNPVSRKVILLAERDNWQKDFDLIEKLIKHIKKTGHKILWEDPAAGILHAIQNLQRSSRWLPPVVFRIGFKLTRLFYCITRKNYFAYLEARKKIIVRERCRNLKETILKAGCDKEVIVLSRSSGGRAASLIADEIPVQHVICISYPFQHPQKGPEPERYEHLASLHTPLLILQGTQDVYGGIEIKEKYHFSSSVELCFLNTNHDFDITPSDWKQVFKKIDAIINT